MSCIIPKCFSCKYAKENDKNNNVICDAFPSGNGVPNDVLFDSEKSPCAGGYSFSPKQEVGHGG